MKTIYIHECKECGDHSFDFHTDSHNCGQNYYWVCDNCGIQMIVCFSDNGMTVTQEPTGRRCERTKVLLKLNDTNIALVVNGCRWGDKTDRWEDKTDNKDADYYTAAYYEEQTCPINVVQRCENIVCDGDEDRHGIFSFIEQLDITGPNKCDEDEAHEMMLQRACQITTG